MNRPLVLLVSLAMTAVSRMDASPPTPVFISVSRSSESAVFLEESGGALFVQRGLEPPKAMIRLDLPPRLSRRPNAIALWRSEWLATNGSAKLLRFSSEGHYLGEQVLPGSMSGLVTAGDALWIYTGLGTRGVAEFWSSHNGVRFDAAANPGRPLAKSAIAAVVEGQAVLAGRPDGALLAAYLIGPPTLFRISVDHPAKTWSVTYQRSAERGALESYRNDRQELTDYSAPVRDLVANPDGTVLVLRNREDRRAGKQLQSEVGLRVDQYAPDGTHIGTATFGETIRWILRSRGKEIVVLTQDGRVARGSLGPPQPAGLVD